jgi:N6-adenosine-specific RNA methylase IME4
MGETCSHSNDSWAEAARLVPGRYRHIVIDPPWDYNRDKGWHGFNGEKRYQIHPTYTLMTVDEMRAMTVFLNALAEAEGSHLWIWTTGAFMRETYDLAEAWGWYDPRRKATGWRATYVWVKNTNGAGMGRWCRNDTEYLLQFSRGKTSPPGKAKSNVIMSPPTGHSIKPGAAYDLIDELYPEGDRIDVFGRRGRLGWQVWGDGK